MFYSSVGGERDDYYQWKGKSMRRPKTDAWRLSPVSKVLALCWSLLKESEISLFFAYMSPLKEFLYISMIILIQFDFFLFPYSLQTFSGYLMPKSSF